MYLRDITPYTISNLINIIAIICVEIQIAILFVKLSTIGDDDDDE